MPPKKTAKKGKAEVKKEEKVAEPPPPPKPPTPAPIPAPSPEPIHGIEPNEHPLPVIIRSQGGSTVADDDFYANPADVTPIGHNHVHHTQEDQFVERFDNYDDVPPNHGNGWGVDRGENDDDFDDGGHSAGGWGTGGGWGTPADGGRNSGMNQGGWGRQSVAEQVNDGWEPPRQPLDQAKHHPPSPAPPPNVASPPPQPAAIPQSAPTPQPQPAANTPQPSAGQPPHPVWGPYPPPSEGPRKYISASEMAKKREASQIPPPAPQSQPPQPPQPQQQNPYPSHPGRPMPPPAGSRASHSASASIYNNWGQPKNVDPWGDPKPRGAPPPPPQVRGPPPQPVRQAWQDWGRPPASRSVSGQSVPPPMRPPPAAHGWGYDDADDYSDETDESDEEAEGWPQPTPSAWRAQGQGRHPAHQHTHSKPAKVTFSSPVASDAGGARNVLSGQQHDDLYSSLLNSLPQSQLSAHTPKTQPHPHQGHPFYGQGHARGGHPQSMHGHPQQMHGHPQQMHGHSQQMHGHPQQMRGYPPQAHPAHGWDQHPPAAPHKQGKSKKAHGGWGDDGWNDQGSGWGGGHDDEGDGWGGHGGGGWGGNEDDGWGAQGEDDGRGRKTKKTQHGGGWDDHGGWDKKSAKKGQPKDAWGQGSNGGWDDAGGWPDEGKKVNGKKDKRGGSAGGWGAADDGWGAQGGDEKGWGKAADGWDGGDGDGWDQPKHGMKGGKGTGSGWDDNWGAEDEEDDWDEEDGYDDPWEEARRGEQAQQHKQRKMSWGDSQAESYTMPSKTMTHAYNGTYTQPIDAPQTQKMNEYTDIRFVESHTQAFEKVQAAFFGRSRKAKERIHWMFSSQKDARVRAHIDWLTKVEYSLGSYGLHKFLQTRERGALFTNVLHRAEGHPSEPAFDWLTFKQVQSTLDPIIQDSVIGYDPSLFVYVFVFLPSESGNSVAMWRRKVLVPNNTRLRFQQEIAIALSGLKKEKDYQMMLDQPIPRLSPKTPPKDPKAQAKTQKKGTLKRSNKVVTHKRSKSLPNVNETNEKKKKRKWWQVLRFAD